jgi:hypothetical protein
MTRYPLMRPQTYGLLGVLCVLLLALMMQGCATLTGPTDAAETVEQKAFALYGTYVVFEERAADLIRNPDVPNEAKQAIQDAAVPAKPVADSVLELVLAAEGVSDEFEDSEDDLLLVSMRLEAWIAEFEPLLASLIAAVGDAL